MPIYIKKNRKGEFFFRITGKNNELLVSGETLKNKGDNLKTLNAILKELEEVCDETGLIDPSKLVDQTKKKQKLSNGR